MIVSRRCMFKYVMNRFCKKKIYNIHNLQHKLSIFKAVMMYMYMFPDLLTFVLKCRNI